MTVRTSLACLALALSAASCSSATGSGGAAAPTPSGDGSNVVRGQWVPLFDGKSLAGWRGYKTDTVPSGWRVVDGTLAKTSPVADIVTIAEYADFELEVEWKIAQRGNAGIFYRGNEEFDHIYWTAPEYQLLDDSLAADNKTRLTSAGAAYGLYGSPPGHLKPIGEWNSTRIVAKGNHVEHWLNGFKLLEYELNSPDWLAKVNASKFKVWPKYGKLAKGHIAFQGDHSGALAFRNIRIREF
jgi:hypothetical protein